MIVLDVNVVLALARADEARHATTIGWLRDISAAGELFGVPNLVWHAFIRIATNRKVYGRPSTYDSLFSFSSSLQGYHGYLTAEPGPRHLTLFREICEQVEARGNLVTDAAIAAIAIENGAGVASFDRDFARFRSLRWTIPGDANAAPPPAVRRRREAERG